jgi:hypothetical protein
LYGTLARLSRLRVFMLWRVLHIEFYDDRIFRRKARLSVKAMMATILQNQLTSRGVQSLTPSDYEEIVELLIEQLRDFELRLAVREITDKQKP